MSKTKEIVIGDKSKTSCNLDFSKVIRKRRETTGGYQEAKNGPLKWKTTYTLFIRAYLRNFTHQDVCIISLLLSTIFHYAFVFN